jgi:catechol-2,3-dioxygenase
MIPKIEGIDHIHVFVSDRKRAQRWYQEVLGFEPVPELAQWATEAGGPLAISDRSVKFHLALFERPAQPCRSTIALAVGKDAFLAWRAHLTRTLGRSPELQDHQITWSMYFSDPDGNPFEITSHDYAALEPSLRREGR